MRIVAAACAGAVTAATGAVAASDLDAVVGRALFERNWTSAPASTDSSDGLGPLFNARSCAGCHTGPALAARVSPEPDGRISGRGLVVRFGDQAGRPDPTYGRLLQVGAVQGLSAEGSAAFLASPDGGHDLSLSLDRGELAPATRVSVRLAPPLAGRAALNEVPAEAVQALADPDDRDGDGISGRAVIVDNDGVKRLGRYGWKAGIATLEDQIADAFAHDLGLSSPLAPLPFGDCTERQADCMAAPIGASELNDGHELSSDMIAAVAEFLRGRDAGSRAPDEAGPRILAEIGCTACHTPTLPLTGGGSVAVYSDLLVHDMGPALDDGVGEAGASSAEWRTAPLIALSAGEGRRYLHDGRAGTADEAIRWHGGEAAAARARYERLPEGERHALLDYLAGL